MEKGKDEFLRLSWFSLFLIHAMFLWILSVSWTHLSLHIDLISAGLPLPK